MKYWKYWKPDKWQWNEIYTMKKCVLNEEINEMSELNMKKCQWKYV